MLWAAMGEFCEASSFLSLCPPLTSMVTWRPAVGQSARSTCDDVPRAPGQRRGRAKRCSRSRHRQGYDSNASPPPQSNRRINSPACGCTCRSLSARAAIRTGACGARQALSGFTSPSTAVALRSSTEADCGGGGSGLLSLSCAAAGNPTETTAWYEASAFTLADALRALCSARMRRCSKITCPVEKSARRRQTEPAVQSQTEPAAPGDLLALGADPTLRDEAGRTPVDVTSDNCCRPALDALAQAHAAGHAAADVALQTQATQDRLRQAAAAAAAA